MSNIGLFENIRINLIEYNNLKEERKNIREQYTSLCNIINNDIPRQQIRLKRRLVQIRWNMKSIENIIIRMIQDNRIFYNIEDSLIHNITRIINQ